MIHKRSIPRMATAALTLGGAVTGAGCESGSIGSPGGSAVEAFCRHLIDCYAGSYRYADSEEYLEYLVDTCARGYNQFLSYYDAMCRRGIRETLHCFSRRVSCEEWYEDDFSDCYGEIDYEYAQCFEPSDPSLDASGGA